MADGLRFPTAQDGRVVGSLCWDYVERSRSGQMVGCWIGDVGIMIAWETRGRQFGEAKIRSLFWEGPFM